MDPLCRNDFMISVMKNHGFIHFLRFLHKTKITPIQNACRIIVFFIELRSYGAYETRLSPPKKEIVRVVIQKHYRSLENMFVTE